MMNFISDIGANTDPILKWHNTIRASGAFQKDVL